MGLLAAWLIVASICVAALGLTPILLRAVAREAERAREAVVSSPWNDMVTLEGDRARIGAVVSLEGEMLIELNWLTRRGDHGRDTTWLIGPVSVAALVTLGRWHDDDSVVAISSAPDGYRMRTPELQVTVHAVPAAHPSRTADS